METPDSSGKTVNISNARRGLGRGLDALLPPASPAAPAGDIVREIPISSIAPNPHQPRQHFHPERLAELAQSIKSHGVMQPIVVRRLINAALPGEHQRFMLIAGERRWRAAAIAGVPTVPAVVRDIPDQQILELTLIENIQREDLNPIEIADSFARLASEANLTHEQIAQRTGKDRVTVTNLLRLLRLPPLVRDYISEGKLTLGHAKALLALGTEEAQKALATRIVIQGLSVRQAEGLVRSEPHKPNKKVAPTSTAVEDPNVRVAVLEMERTLGTRVRLEGSGERGKITIEYHSADDLERIYSWITAGR